MRSSLKIGTETGPSPVRRQLSWHRTRRIARHAATLPTGPGANNPRCRAVLGDCDRHWNNPWLFGLAFPGANDDDRADPVFERGKIALDVDVDVDGPGVGHRVLGERLHGIEGEQFPLHRGFQNVKIIETIS